ncbi:hypothetical protein ABPG74_017668 [Tetrahymena malaccensis]
MSRKNPQIYITNFSSRTTEEDLNYEFKRFGKIQDINMKRSYAFITYHDHHDADDAVRKMDKTTLNGKTIVVEPAGLKKTRSRGPQPDDKCYSCGRRGHWANECEEKKRRYRRSSSRSSSRSRSRSRTRRSSRRKHSRSSPSNSRSNSSRRSRSRSDSKSSSKSKSDSRSRSKSSKSKESKSKSRSPSKDKN